VVVFCSHVKFISTESPERSVYFLVKFMFIAEGGFCCVVVIWGYGEFSKHSAALNDNFYQDLVRGCSLSARPVIMTLVLWQLVLLV
jgi:hypothetical protein